jgi:hypothetical protein
VTREAEFQPHHLGGRYHRGAGRTAPGPGCARGTATLSATGDDLGREAHASGQRADELNKRLLHIGTEVVPQAFGLRFELGQLSL